MSFFGDIRHTPAATKPPGSDPNLPLTNLAIIQSRMEKLHNLLSDSVNANTPLGQPQLSLVSSEIAAAIQHLIVNAAALLSSASTPSLPSLPDPVKVEIEEAPVDDDDDFDLIEMDAVELLAEHVHFCEICGKGFKRDANLRMHMRAHGNQFKTPEALAKPEKVESGGVIGKSTRKVRFSCPFVGCNRNKLHKKFRPLKSAICVKNHFKRSHCPKMYSCNRCNKKSFSVVADLKSHLKHCGETKWKCSCGTTFSRKDKLFGHMALFEGHMPAVVDDAEEKKMEIVVEDDDVDMGNNGGLADNGGSSSSKDGSLERFLDTYTSMENSNWFQEGFNSPNSMSSGMEGFFNF